MYLPKSLLAICSKDSARYTAIDHVYVDVDEKVAVATDGHRLVTYAVVPEAEEVSGYVPREAIEHAWKQKGAFQGVLRHLADVTLVESTSFPNPYAGQDAPTYPDWRTLTPPGVPSQIALNAEFLLALARVLSPDKPEVTLAFTPGKLGPIVVTGAREDSTGLLMPCRMATPADTPAAACANGLNAMRLDAECTKLRAEVERLKHEHAAQYQGWLGESAALREQIAALTETLDTYRQCYGGLPWEQEDPQEEPSAR